MAAPAQEVPTFKLVLGKLLSYLLSSLVSGSASLLTSFSPLQTLYIPRHLLLFEYLLYPLDTHTIPTNHSSRAQLLSTTPFANSPHPTFL